MKKCQRCGEIYSNEAFKSHSVASKGKLFDNCDMCRVIIDEQEGSKRSRRGCGTREIEIRKLTIDEFRALEGADNLKKNFQTTTHRLTEPLL